MRNHSIREITAGIQHVQAGINGGLVNRCIADLNDFSNRFGNLILRHEVMARKHPAKFAKHMDADVNRIRGR